MSITIGLDFGSLSYRAAYVLDGEVVSVPMPPDEAAWRGLVFVDPDRKAALGLDFSSLKYQLGTGKRFSWRGSALQAEDAVLDIFSEIRRAVQTYAGERIGRAVLAVPARYSGRRREILRDLGSRAGLGEIDLVNDCTAAALGHLQEPGGSAKTLLIYSMGFFGYEVSLVRHAAGELRELVHEGAERPSGRDFDLLAMAGVVDLMRREGTPLPTRVFTSQWFDFRLLASDCKEQLSGGDEALFLLPPYLTGAESKRIRFLREDFEGAIADNVDSTIEAVRRGLEEVGIEPAAVDEVVLAGGSTRVGAIQSRLGELFGRAPVQPRDDLIARGAAVHADRLAVRAPAPVLAPEPQPETEPVTELPPASVREERTEPQEEALPSAPDTEGVLAQLRRLAAAGGTEATRGYLDALEQGCREIRAELNRRES